MSSPRAIRENAVEWVVNDLGELGVCVNGQYFFLYKGASLQYGKDSDCRRHGVAVHDDGTPMMVRMVGKREFGETCQPLPHFRSRWPGGEGAKYLEPLVYTSGLSFGKPEDGDWQPLPAPPDESLSIWWNALKAIAAEAAKSADRLSAARDTEDPYQAEYIGERRGLIRAMEIVRAYLAEEPKP